MAEMRTTPEQRAAWVAQMPDREIAHGAVAWMLDLIADMDTITDRFSRPDSLQWMNLDEFVDAGFLQEANRLFFHPLGLALTVNRDDETREVTAIIGVQDYRHDAEGFLFGKWNYPETPGHGLADAERKAASVAAEFERHAETRELLLGHAIQAVGQDAPEVDS